MRYIYVTEPGAKVGLSGGNIKGTKDGNEIMTAPKQMVEAISIFGNAQMTTQCMRFCLVNGIRVSLFSKVGAYFGYITSTNHVSIAKQKQQIKIAKNKIDEAENMEQVMGYEGSASRGYFQVLSGI